MLSTLLNKGGPHLKSGFYKVENNKGYFSKNGKCYRWVTVSCVYQPSRDLIICAKKEGGMLKFVVPVSCHYCGCCQ